MSSIKVCDNKGMSAVDLKITGDNLWDLIRDAYRQGGLDAYHDAITGKDNKQKGDVLAELN